jgi:glyoxylase-like metal-dependent hydrolase (beta-lactamase superfamily II)
MTFSAFTGGFCQTNAYLIEAGGRRVLVDAPDDCAEWLRARGATVDALLLTHQHFDHVMDAARVVADHACPVYAWTQPSPALWLSTLFSEMTGWTLEVPPYRVDHELAGRSHVEAAGIAFDLIHVPGHSPDSVCFHHVASAHCFCGDTVFASGIGRSDFPGGDGELLIAGIQEKLLALPEHVALLPGHGPPTTVGAETRENPFLAAR